MRLKSVNRVVLSTATLLVLAGRASGDVQETVDELRAVPIKSTELILEVEDGKVTATSKEGITPNHITETTVFSSSGRVRVTVKEFNPLTTTLELTSANAPDSTANSLSTLGKALSAFTGIEVPQGSMTPQSADALKGKAADAAKAGASADKEPCNLMVKALEVLKKQLELDITEKRINDIAALAIGQDGAKKAADEFRAEAGKLATAAGLAQKALKRIEELGGETPCAADTKMISLVVADLFEGRARLTKLQKRSEALTKLAEVLEGSKWSEKRYLAGHIEPSSFVSIKVQRFQFSAEDDGSVTRKPVKDSEIKVGKFKLVPQRFLAVEIVAAGVYVDANVPKYDTAEKDGQTVIAVRQEPIDLSAAVMANMIAKLTPTDQVFPMAQIGVSAQDSAPALLFGVGVRIRALKNFAVSVGKMRYRPRELQSLTDGSPIGGTADIQKDLKRKTHWANYVSVQVAF